MTEKEFNLSDEKQVDEYQRETFYIDDVKEFIKRLKKEIAPILDPRTEVFKMIIDKLAGEDLK